MTGSQALFGAAVEIGRAIKQDIRQRLRLVASVGVAPNKFLAKIASDLNKPAGFVVVEPGQEQTFLHQLPVGMSGLDQPAAVQLSLFPDPQHEQQTRLDEVSDRIREKFGGGSPQRGLGMLHDVEGRAGGVAERDQDGG